jgi:hypothetical protein
MNKIKLLLCIGLLLVHSLASVAEITIINSSLISFQVNNKSICGCQLLNSGSSESISIHAKLLDSFGNILLESTSTNFVVQNGLNNIIAQDVLLLQNSVGSSNLAQYIASTGLLPSGNFQICIQTIPSSGEPPSEFCDQLTSDLSQFLTLVSPSDKDTITTLLPILTWNHSEPFNILIPGENYRIKLVEVHSDQNAEEAFYNNMPLFVRENVTSHIVPYPPEANTLEKGKKYSWAVQRTQNGVVTNSTDIWEFIIKNDSLPKDIKYFRVTNNSYNQIYSVVNNKIYFVIDDDKFSGLSSYAIYNSKLEKVEINIAKDIANTEQGATNSTLFNSGYNRLMLDISQYDLNTGSYTLELIATKGKKYKLSFLVP